MSKPTLFISHKHADSAIAQVIGTFIEERSNNAVDVYLSSNPSFKGPKIGKGLNGQLRQSLWNTEVLLLVYTSADQDWQYCMWECGVATHPQSPDSTIIVFQCGSDSPAPFQDVLRVNPRRYDDIKKFTDQFLRDSGFFASLKAALAPDLKDSHIENAATDFFKKISDVLPPFDDGLTEEWPTWPYLRLELPRTEVEKIEKANDNERENLTKEIVKNFGIVVDSDPRAAQLFGQAVLPQKLKFDHLFVGWKEKYPKQDSTWFDSFCEQIMMGAMRGFPVIRWSHIREVGGDAEFTPVVSRIRRVPFGGKVQFDFYFYNLSDPRAVPVTLRMIPAGNFFYKDLGKVTLESLKLKELVAELDLQRLNRVPIFNKEGHAIYIVHRSMIDKFIVKRVMSATGSFNPAELTLADLLSDPEMKEMFQNTFAVVKRKATLSEAKSAMLLKPGCSDVFVTAEGGSNEAVQGWLTNVDIVRNS